MGYYRGSASSLGSGCGTVLLFIGLGIVFVTLLVTGCSSVVSHIDFEGDWNKRPVKQDNHLWGENGVDPVLRTSTGGVYKDPSTPDYYFDITLWCPTCDGLGCDDCFNTGHPKVRIPANGELPKKKKLPDDYFSHKGASKIKR